MIEVRTPDGQTFRFPEGTDQATMKAAIDRHFAQARPSVSETADPVVGAATGRPAPELPANLYSGANAGLFSDDGTSTPSVNVMDPVQGDPTGASAALETVQDNVVGMDNGVMSPGEKLGTLLNIGGESMTFGAVGDEADAAVRTALGSRSYDENLERNRSKEAQLREENPYLSLVAEIGGGMAVPGGVMASAGRGLLVRMGLGAAVAGAGAGAYGFAEGEGGFDDRRANAVTPGLLGAGLGAAVPAAGAGISRGIGRIRDNRAIRAAVDAAPTREELASRAGALFDGVRDARIPTERMPALAENVTAMGREYGMDPMLMPNASRVSNNLSDLAQTQAPDVSWQDLNIIRRQAAVPAGNLANRPESAVGSQMIDAIDGFVDDVAPSLGAAGREARDMWGTLRRSEMIDSAFERAKTAASGFENGLQIEFRRILRNPKMLRGFSDAEVKAMKSVVNGGVLHGLLRQVGRLGFSLDGGSNAVGGAFGVGAGSLLGGPVGGILAGVVGTGARKGSEVLRTNAANRAASLVRTPQAVQLPVTQDPTRGLLGDILLRSVRAGSAATAN